MTPLKNAATAENGWSLSGMTTIHSMGGGWFEQLRSSNCKTTVAKGLEAPSVSGAAVVETYIPAPKIALLRPQSKLAKCLDPVQRRVPAAILQVYLRVV